MLLLHNCNVDLQDNRGMTALHYAARHDQYLIALDLLDSGARTDIEATVGWTAQRLTAFEIGACSGALSITQRLARSYDIRRYEGLYMGMVEGHVAHVFFDPPL
jgi:hypothetical protein